MADLSNALEAFVTSFLGNNDQQSNVLPQHRQSIMAMCRGIISSNIAPPIGSNEKSISEQIQKDLILHHPNSQQALKFKYLYEKLKDINPDRDRWPILYYMFQCSHQVTEPAFGRIEYPPEFKNSRGLEDILRASAHRELPPSQTMDNVTEEELIRDIIFVMQGIDGKHIIWDNRRQVYIIQNNVVISSNLGDLTRRLTEVGRLYRYIRDYVEEEGQSGGLVTQSLCSSLQEELRQYYKLVAILEAQQAKVDLDTLPGESSSGLTLRRINTWITEPLHKLRLIDWMVEKCKECKGGQTLSKIHTFTVNGDPFIQEVSNKLLAAASEPFNDILVRWITIGELVDPHEECFIRENHEVPPQDMWRNRYSLDYDMIPIYMDPEITKKIFLIGKSLNFLRMACNDADWVIEQEAPSQVIHGLRNPTALDAFVNSVYSRVSKRLMEVLMNKYRLMEHISAMKRYLLLEQGDFVLALIENMGTQMDQPGRIHYRHNLMATVETAIRSSNAQFDDSEFLRRIDVRISDTKHARNGWDVFNLRYQLDAPLSYLLSENTLNYYYKLSFFLLRLKRVGNSLQMLWHRQMVSARLSVWDKNKNRESSSSKTGKKNNDSENRIDVIFVNAKAASNEMIQFIQQLERYIYLKVIEGAWEKLKKVINDPIAKINKDTTGVDGWISAHNEYIVGIYRTLLGKRLNYGNILTRVFDTILQFCAHANELLDDAIIQSRNKSKNNADSQSANTGNNSGGGGSGSGPKSNFSEFLEKMNSKYKTKLGDASPMSGFGNNIQEENINKAITKFREQICDLIRILVEHPDTEMHFLAVSFDFNEFYSSGVGRAAAHRTSITSDGIGGGGR
ncbi:Microtubule-nucleating Tub4p (gamma-tubulin) complex component [Mycoemilia scoparia]|uniref:Microtubule-nucleating Tub4p (Gamma-tubulin) complex component n=1 Tax=Mycoemilia scoparia TaxID=417184 RepID=A0A9W8A2G9_9FUNG|nr:Microtubule-nucleating Tub4p (gamma-tubulin) complex component [Mycoemilia scoparia]